MSRLVLYVAAPLRPTVEEIDAAIRDSFGPPMRPEFASARALRANLERAMRWLTWLRRSFPETTFIAPWIAAVLTGDDDCDETQREAGLIDDCAVVERCDGIVLVGARVSSGMRRESDVMRPRSFPWRLPLATPPEHAERPTGTFIEWAHCFRELI